VKQEEINTPIYQSVRARKLANNTQVARQINNTMLM